METIKGKSSKVMLVILDGFGINPDDYKNAVKHAKTPHLDQLFKNYPYTEIVASGTPVGLPKGVIGNSEVGHLNIGAGRPVTQDFVKINQAIEKNELKDMEKMRELINRAKRGSKRIHLMGLLSDGGVHSHIEHIKKIIEVLSAEPDLKIYFHAFMDGRDTARDSGVTYVVDLRQTKGFIFASMQGRSIGMDRDRRWEKTKRAYQLFIGEGQTQDIDPEEYILSEYKKEIYDEFITPILFKKEGKIEKDDCVFFMNFRPDRAIQLTLAFTDPKFNYFKTPIRPAYYLCMSPYVQGEVDLPILFDKEVLPNGLGEYLSDKGKKQFRIAETEKFAHVTFFFNGGRKEPFKNEERILIPSPKEVATYDLKPEMSAYEVCHTLLEKLDDSTIDFFLVNFANCDMVGHTGNFEATIKAVETVDTCVGKLMDRCLKNNITMLLTADHGNSDQMIYEDGSPHTSHTGSLVPFVFFNKMFKNQKVEIREGELALKDIAPTILYTLNLECPTNFSGKSIFK